MHASRSVNEREAILLEAKSILDKNGDSTSNTRAALLMRLAEHSASLDLNKSLAFATESISVQRNLPPAQELGAVLYLAGLSSINLGHDAQADAYLTEAIAVSRKFRGDPNPDLARYYAFAAEAQGHQMKYRLAEQNLRLALQSARALGGDTDMDTLESESRFGTFLVSTSRSREALPYLQKAKDVFLKTNGPEDPFYTPQMLIQYGMALYADGRPEEALEFVTAAVKNRRRNRPNTRFLGQMLEDQAQILLDLGRYRSVAQLLEEAAQIKIKVGGKMDANSLTPQIGLELALAKPQAAVDLIDRFYPPPPESAPLSIDLLRNLEAHAKVALATQDGKTAVAVARRALDLIASTPLQPYLKFRQATAMLDGGQAYLLEHDPDKALPLLLGAVKADTELFDPSSPRLGAADATLGICYLELGDRANAKSFLARAETVLHAHQELADQYRQPARELAKRLAARPSPPSPKLPRRSP